MEAENLQIVSWKIENLSCWNQALHGKCIESPDIYFNTPDLKMKLYPRGTSGQEEHVVVHLSIDHREGDFSGDLSFINADGSTLCTQQVHSKEKKSDIELPPGPNFEEVIVKNRENESDHGDTLTLRFQIKSKHRYEENQVCTIIQVFDITLEIDCNVIQKGQLISSIRCLHDNYHSQIHLKTDPMREGKKIKLYLDPFKDDKFPYSLQTHLRFINSVGSLIRYEKNEHVFLENKPWTFSDSLSKEELSEKVRSLILRLKISSGIVTHTLQNVFLKFDDIKNVPNRYLGDCKQKSIKTHVVIAYNDQENAVDVLSKELMSLYQDQDFSNLQLKCDNVSFPVHRNILSARSPVFKTMLSSDMKEAASGCVDIVDLDACTLSRFLTFLYTGAVEDLQGESAFKLYNAADKYQVPSLKKECVNFLRANVSVSNVCDVLSVGDKQEDDELTAAAHNFILTNFNLVLKSSEWNSFMRSEPLLAVKTVTHFAAKDFVGKLNPL